MDSDTLWSQIAAVSKKPRDEWLAAVQALEAAKADLDISLAALYDVSFMMVDQEFCMPTGAKLAVKRFSEKPIFTSSGYYAVCFGAEFAEGGIPAFEIFIQLPSLELRLSEGARQSVKRSSSIAIVCPLQPLIADELCSGFARWVGWSKSRSSVYSTC
jgi:hypothetical protein